MALTFRSLASGSSGNAYLFSSGTTHVLIDAGLPAGRLLGYLAAAGVDPQQLSAVFLTHEHSDHVRGLAQLLRSIRVPVYGSSGTLGEAERIVGPFVRRDLPLGGSVDFADCAITSFGTPHDSAASCGYQLADTRWTVCLATDIGWPDPRLASWLAGADLVVLEANHDRELLLDGNYPWHLKRRIAGDRGHLSNEQCAELLVRSHTGRPRDVWLAHLSKAHNAPDLARRAVASAIGRAGLSKQSLEIALRDRPSLVWKPTERARQLRFDDYLVP